MDDWIDYYDSTHTIYASKLHRNLHFQRIAKDIIGYIASPDAVVLDYACGEALSAGQVAEACARLYLAEPAPGVRGRLTARFARNPNIQVRSLDDVPQLAEGFALLRAKEEFALDVAAIAIRRRAVPEPALELEEVPELEVEAA